MHLSLFLSDGLKLGQTPLSLSLACLLACLQGVGGSLSLSLSFFLQGVGVVYATLRPSGPPSPHVVFRKRLALGPPLTEVLYYWVGSRFSCSKRPAPYSNEPAHPGLIPAPLWLPYDYFLSLSLALFVSRLTVSNLQVNSEVSMRVGSGTTLQHAATIFLRQGSTLRC